MAYIDLYDGYFAKGRAERGQAGSALTGEIAAALGTGNPVWTLRYPELIGPKQGASGLSPRLYIERIHVTFTTLTAFTTPVTAGRHLRLHRGAPTDPVAGANNPTGGAAFVMAHKRSDLTETLAVGRVATTGGLTTTGITFEAASQCMRRLSVAHAGASGAFYDEVWIFDGKEADPIVLLPGQLLGLLTGQAMDAAGTWQVSVDVDAVEIVG
jgi:hypothetical protein